MMEGIMSTEFVVLVFTTVSGGIGYLVKRYLDTLEKRRSEETDERNRKREEIIREIAALKEEMDDLKRDLAYAQCLLFGCDSPKCGSRQKWGEYIARKNGLKNENDKDKTIWP